LSSVRIQDVYPGSIPDLRFFHPGSNNNKKEEAKKLVVLLKIIIFLDRIRKKNLTVHQELKYFGSKNCTGTKLSEIWVVIRHPGSGILKKLISELGLFNLGAF
jgi:hypothetical protein